MKRRREQSGRRAAEGSSIHNGIVLLFITLTVLIKATGGAGVTGWEAGLHPGRVTGPSEDTHCLYTHLEEV